MSQNLVGVGLTLGLFFCIPLLLLLLPDAFLYAEAFHVCNREVIPLDRTLVEVEAPDLRHLLLCVGELLVEFALVEVFKDGVEVRDSVIVILLLVEDASDVVDSQRTLL